MFGKIIWAVSASAGLVLLALSALPNPRSYAWADDAELAGQLRLQSIDVGMALTVAAVVVILLSAVIGERMAAGGSVRRAAAPVSAALLLLTGVQALHYDLLLQAWRAQEAATGPLDGTS